MASHCNRSNCNIDEKCVQLILKGRRGKPGDPGVTGPPGNGVGSPSSQTFTPLDNSTVLVINPDSDIAIIDTSNFSPILTLGAPTCGVSKTSSGKDCNCNSNPTPTSPTPPTTLCTHYLELKLLYQWGLTAQIQLISGGTVELSASNPNTLLFWDGVRWNVINNPIDTNSVYPDSVNQVKLTPTGNVGTSFLGGEPNSVALSANGTTLAVGGDSDNGSIGATWVFIRTSTPGTGASASGSWTQQGSKLVANDSIAFSLQGSAVALSSDGNTLAVGGRGDNSTNGATWIFVRIGSAWIQQGLKIVALDNIGAAAQGTSVALSSDGNTLAIGGRLDNSNTGATWIFTRSAGVWTEQAKLVGIGGVGNAQQGTFVALSSDGNTLAVGGPLDNGGVGATWIFTRFDGTWAQQTNPPLTGTGNTGASLQGSYVSLSANGNILAVGGPADNANTGAVWIFVRSNPNISGISWTQQAGPLIATQPSLDPITTPPSFGVVSLTGDGNTLAVGGPTDKNNTGAVWIYRNINGFWTQFSFRIVGLPTAVNQNQGTAVAISSDGSVLASTAPGDNSGIGAVFIFQ
jgi:hypothetical protein